MCFRGCPPLPRGPATSWRPRPLPASSSLPMKSGPCLQVPQPPRSPASPPGRSCLIQHWLGPQCPGQLQASLHPTTHPSNHPSIHPPTPSHSPGSRLKLLSSLQVALLQLPPDTFPGPLLPLVYPPHPKGTARASVYECLGASVAQRQRRAGSGARPLPADPCPPSPGPQAWDNESCSTCRALQGLGTGAAGRGGDCGGGW